MRPPEMARLEKPPPRPFAFHASGGRDAGHCLSSPDSLAMASRLGPRHCGHSDAVSGAATAKAAEMPRMKRRMVAGRARNLNISDLLSNPPRGLRSYNEAAGAGVKEGKISVTATPATPDTAPAAGRARRDAGLWRLRRARDRDRRKRGPPPGSCRGRSPVLRDPR